MFADEIKDSVVSVLGDMGDLGGGEQVILEHPADLAHGDYSSNIALVLAKRLNKNPREVAEQVVIKWQKIGLPDCVEKVEVAGPGFINIWLNFESLSKYLDKLLKKSGVDGGFEGGGGRRTMMLDYSAPNIAKSFGVGHLRSTNIGQAIYNIYKFLGWRVIGDNHLGDWGTQFGRLIYQINVKCQMSNVKCNKEEFTRSLTIEDLEKLYVEFHKDLEQHPELEEEARKWFKKLEEGDKEAREIWQACVDISLKEFDRIYKLLGVKIDYALGESFYQDKMQAVLDDCREKGILKESEGAQVVEIPGMGIPGMLVKSDGATTYLLRDLAAVKYRMQKWRPDLIVYEVGADQTLHFKQLFKICELLGYGNLSQFVHVAHGLMRWPSGKFSTRKGMTIHLEEVLNEAIEKAKKLSQKSTLRKDNPTKDLAIASEFVGGEGCREKGKRGKGGEERIVKAVGVGAVKYNDLKQNPRTDIVFDWEQILTLSGNSGPYLQYTYARTQSVLTKSEILNPKSETNSKFPERISSKFNGASKIQNFNNETMEPDFAKATTGRQLNNEEITLLRTIYKFPEIVEEAGREFSPNLLCNFLFDLCQKFNLFYDKHQILMSNVKCQMSNVGDEVIEEQSNFRLVLTAAVGKELKSGLTLLGIEALERM